MSGAADKVLTVGHSNHSPGKFVGLLQAHGVTAVADVRSAPYSRFNPAYNREALRSMLKSHGIVYTFLGRELGARTDDESCYDNGRVSYGRLAKTELFQRGIERVIDGASRWRIALMCAEREPLECHRTLLVARALENRGVEVAHILPNGRLEPHEQTLDRLPRVHRLPEYLDRDYLIEKSVELQEAKIAYVNKELAHKSSVTAQ